MGLRTYCVGLLPTRVPTAGKLEPLGEDSRLYEGQSIKATKKKSTTATGKKSITATEKKSIMATEKKRSGITPVAPAGGYRVERAINGVPTSFLLDTGAAVALLRRDTWANVTVSHPQELNSWSIRRLVSADGSPLTIHGSAVFYGQCYWFHRLQYSGKKLSCHFI